MSDENTNSTKKIVSVAESLRNQPVRKSLVGGVKTRQPDYEQRHLEMMKYLATLKHGKDSDNTRGNLPSSSFSSSSPRDIMLRNFHQSEIDRIREEKNKVEESENEEGPSTKRNFFARKYKNQTDLTMMNDERKKHILQSAQSHLRDIDPATGLPRENIGTMGLKNHPGMQRISPWMILYQYVRQVFRSKIVVIVVLGFVLLLNFRRFGVLLQIHHPNNNHTVTNNMTRGENIAEEVEMKEKGNA